MLNMKNINNWNQNQSAGYMFQIHLKSDYMQHSLLSNFLGASYPSQNLCIIKSSNIINFTSNEMSIAKSKIKLSKSPSLLHLKPDT